MAQLTWRNVDNPDFSGVGQSLGLFTRLLNNAGEAAQSGLDTYKAGQTDAADRAILARAQQITDPAAYAAAMKAGTIAGPDAANASLEALRGLDTRAGTLIQNAASQEALDNNTYAHQRTKEGNTLSDAAAPALAEFHRRASTGDIAGANAYLADHPEISAMRPEDYTSALKSASDLETGVIGQNKSLQDIALDKNRDTRDAARLGLEQQRFNLEKTQKGDNDAATAAFNNLSDTSASQGDLRQNFAKATAGLTPAGKLAVRKSVIGTYGYDPLGVSGDNSSTGSSGGSSKASKAIADSASSLPDLAGDTDIGKLAQTAVDKLSSNLSSDKEAGAYIASLRSDDTDATTVVNGLVAKDGAFPDANRGTITAQINRLVRNSIGSDGKPRLNAAQAGAILSRSADSSKGTIHKLWDGPTSWTFGQIVPNLPHGLSINDSTRDNLAQDAISGNAALRGDEYQDNTRILNQHKNALESYNKALNDLRQFQLDAKVRPAIAENLPRYQKAVSDAESRLQKTTKLIPSSKEPSSASNAVTFNPDDWGNYLSSGGKKSTNTGSATPVTTAINNAVTDDTAQQLATLEAKQEAYASGRGPSPTAAERAQLITLRGLLKPK